MKYPHFDVVYKKQAGKQTHWSTQCNFHDQRQVSGFDLVSITQYKTCHIRTVRHRFPLSLEISVTAQMG